MDLYGSETGCDGVNDLGNRPCGSDLVGYLLTHFTLVVFFYYPLVNCPITMENHNV